MEKIFLNIIFKMLQNNTASAKLSLKRRENFMSNNLVPEAKEALNIFKMEAASEVGVPRPS